MTSIDGRTADAPELTVLPDAAVAAPESAVVDTPTNAVDAPVVEPEIATDTALVARSEWTPSEWHGVMMVDEKGRHLGKLQDVYVDIETAQPVFATVKQGLWPGRHLTFVPLRDVHVEPQQLRVPTSAERVGSAPDLGLHGEELTVEGESTLYHHFEQNYLPTAEGGRRLVRR